MDKKLAILKILSEKPDGVPQSTLAKTLRISKSYLSTLLRDLELQGLIYRVRIGNSYIVKVVRPMISTYHRVYQRKKLKLGIVWSSEYLFLASFAKLLKKRLSLDLEIIVYPSALKTTTALIRGEVDAILSPVITQLYAYALAKELIIVGGGASGGAAIYEIKDSKSETVASSELSTMDVCRAMAIHKNIIDTKDTRYFHEPDEALRIAKQKKARYIVVWHPITESLRRIADRELAKCGDFEELKHCCTLALSRSLDIDTIEKIARIYRDSIEMFKSRPEFSIEWYSSITGIDTSILRKALHVYAYDPEINLKSINALTYTLNIELPRRESLLKSFLI